MSLDVIEKVVPVEVIKEGYKDIVQPAAKEAGSFLAAVVGVFNNVIAAPLHRLNANYKAKTEAYIRDLEQKYSQIPEENRQEPPLNIIGPTLEALKYNLDEDELKQMFTNLLTNSMDNRQNKNVHPSFVEIIKRMNNCDALVLKRISSTKQWIVIKPKFQIKGTSNYYPNVFPAYFIGFCLNEFDIFDISKSLDILNTLGIIKIDTHFSLKDKKYEYDNLKKSELITSRFELIQKNSPLVNGELAFNNGSLIFTEFGNSFVECCLK